MSEPENCMESIWPPLASAVALEIRRLGELNREGRNSHATEALRGGRHWPNLQPRLPTLRGRRAIHVLDRSRGADTALVT